MPFIPVVAGAGQILMQLWSGSHPGALALVIPKGEAQKPSCFLEAVSH